MTSTLTLSNPSSFLSAAGPVPFRLCNDYLFKALMQTDKAALSSLIQAIVRLPDNSPVSSVQILNPIELGTAINDKDFVLDVLVCFQNRYRINIEMQIANEDDWPERSLSYLCRTFDQLNKGEAYQKVKTAIQISLLDYTLFPDTPSFYSSWRMMNTETGAVYSDKFQLYVVCLNHVNLATKADCMCGLDQWARLFRAKTWEEVKMITKDNPILQPAAEHLYTLTQEEKIRYQCEARERRLQFERSKMESRKELVADLSDKIRQIDQKNEQINQQSEQIATLSDENARLAEELKLLREQLNK